MSEQAPEPSIENPNQNTASSQIDSQKKGAWTPEPAGARIKPPAVSPLRRLLPPILGGLTSVPIALGILWYGFGKDIGNAGPTVARYIPWLVPEHLRGSARWRYNPNTDSKQKQFDAPKDLDAGEFGRIGGKK
jgi:hypothetical protein